MIFRNYNDFEIVTMIKQGNYLQAALRGPVRGFGQPVRGRGPGPDANGARYDPGFRHAVARFGSAPAAFHGDDGAVSFKQYIEFMNHASGADLKKSDKYAL